MKKTIPLLLMFLLIILGGCSPEKGDLSQFITQFNETEQFEPLEISDFYSYFSDEITSYIHFFEVSNSCVLLTVSTNDVKGRISSCSLTYKGSHSENSSLFSSLVRTLLIVYCDIDAVQAEERMSHFSIADRSFACESEEDKNYVYTFAFDDAGASFIIESIRFNSKYSLKKPEITDYTIPSSSTPQDSTRQ